MIRAPAYVKGVIRKSLRVGCPVRIVSSKTHPHMDRPDAAWTPPDTRIIVDYTARMETVFEEMAAEIFRDLELCVDHLPDQYVSLSVETPEGHKDYLIEEPM